MLFSFAMATLFGRAAFGQQAHARPGSRVVQAYITNMSSLLDACTAAAKSYRTLLVSIINAKQGEVIDRSKTVLSIADSYKTIARRIDTMRNIPPGAAASRKSWLQIAGAYRLKSATLRKLVSGPNDDALHTMQLIDDHLAELVKQAINEDRKAGILPKVPAASGSGASAGRPGKSPH
jgi:uncharacterized protein HemX